MALYAGGFGSNRQPRSLHFPRNTVSPAYAAWAIALGPTGNPIVGREMPSIPGARRDALRSCNRPYSNCKIVESSNRACAAVAVAGTKWGVGKGLREAEARSAALAACEARGAGTCKVGHAFCGQ